MKDLKAVIFESKRNRHYTENVLGSVVFSMIKIKKLDVYVYGCGGDVESVIAYFDMCDIPIKMFIDADVHKDGKLVMDRIPIVHTSHLQEMSLDSEGSIVIINTSFFAGLEQWKITKVLHDAGLYFYYCLDDADKRQIRDYRDKGRDGGRIAYYRKHYAELQKLYDSFTDESSRETLTEYIRTYMEQDVYRLPQCPSPNKYFWGIDKADELYKLPDDEVWVNCGAYKGDNVFTFFANGLSAKKIYAVEGDKAMYKLLNSHLQYLPDDMRRLVTPLNIFIDENTSFKDVFHEKITLVNADIEGFELELITNMQEVIKNDRPVLAICAYHKASDLVDLPNRISEIVSDYYFALRKYEATYNDVDRRGELVLYAIPKERCLK